MISLLDYLGSFSVLGLAWLAGMFLMLILALCHRAIIQRHRRHLDAAHLEWGHQKVKLAASTALTRVRARPILEEFARSSSSRNPVASMIRWGLDAPSLVIDDLSCWVMCQQTRLKLFGNLPSRIDLNRQLSPMIGLLGTIFGITISTAVLAESGDQAAMMAGTSVAFSTTLLGGFNAIIERLNKVALAALEEQVRTDLLDAVGVMRALQRERPVEAVRPRSVHIQSVLPTTVAPTPLPQIVDLEEESQVPEREMFR